jgi:glycosyltransferase involved in cell wall biosynthesis
MTARVEEYHLFLSQFSETITHLRVKKKEIPKILKNHYGDIFVNPGRYEGFGLSLIEAMSQGLVPVSFPTGVAPEIIRHGRNGFLVNTVGGMIRTVRMLIRKRARRTRIAQEAIKTSKHFKADTIIKEYIKLYNTLEKAEKPKKSK